MPKNVFWPLSLVIIGLILMASNVGLLHRDFLNFWPLLLVIVGLGGLFVSDRKEWIVKEPSKSAPKKSTPAKKVAARRASKRR
jgi:hypothetical protein